jgi:hypothetical protein
MKPASLRRLEKISKLYWNFHELHAGIALEMRDIRNYSTLDVRNEPSPIRKARNG